MQLKILYKPFSGNLISGPSNDKSKDQFHCPFAGSQHSKALYGLAQHRNCWHMEDSNPRPREEHTSRPQKPTPAGQTLGVLKSYMILDYLDHLGWSI